MTVWRIPGAANSPSSVALSAVILDIAEGNCRVLLGGAAEHEGGGGEEDGVAVYVVGHGGTLILHEFRERQFFA
jgi:hypothetical protein